MNKTKIFCLKLSSKPFNFAQEFLVQYNVDPPISEKSNRKNLEKLQAENRKKRKLAILFFTMETVEIDNNVKIEVPWEDDLLCNEIVATKGQLILKCPFGFFKSSKKSTRFFPGFLP